MVVEYKIQFVEGAVIVTQTFTVVRKKPVGPVKLVDVGEAYKGTGGTPPDWSAPAAAKGSKAKGGGEPDSIGTGGGLPIAPGLMIVFGSVVCGGTLSTLGSGEPDSIRTGGQKPS